MSNSPLVEMAMKWIGPNVTQLMKAIDEHEDLYESAKQGIDVVPTLAPKYMPMLANLPPTVSFMVKSMPATTAMMIAQNVIQRSLQEIAVSGDENSSIAKTAQEYPKWLEDQATRLSNLAILMVYRMP